MAVKLAGNQVEQRFLPGKADSLHLYGVSFQERRRCPDTLAAYRTMKPNQSPERSANQQAVIRYFFKHLSCFIHITAAPSI